MDRFNPGLFRRKHTTSTYLDAQFQLRRCIRAPVALHYVRPMAVDVTLLRFTKLIVSGEKNEKLKNPLAAIVETILQQCVVFKPTPPISFP